MGRSLGPLDSKASVLAPKDRINTRISHPGSKAQYVGGTRNHVLQDPCVHRP